MRQLKLHILIYICICCSLLASSLCYGKTGERDFVVVIDPGHGGHDPGAIGRISKEKNINLRVALAVGRLIEQNCPDVKVIYTRKRDVFVALDRRAEIANAAKADLFISIHTNSLARNHTTRGASTWTLGLAKSEANLEVAKRENAVILYEDDYKTRYAGFNPNSAESYIIFEYMQDKYMAQSVHLASLMQKEFRSTCKRVDRGVHQAGFLVLRASAMPSVLIELGFISTPAEERYLNSEQGISNLANGIYRAFLTYKQSQGNHQGDVRPLRLAQTAPTSAPEKTETSSTPAPSTTHHPIFKVQIFASSELLKPTDKRLKGLKGVEHYEEDGLYKYTYGASDDYNRIARTRRAITGKFKQAFIIAFKDGKKMDINQAIREFKENR